MYVLRSKVKVRDAGDETVRLGVAGMGADPPARQPGRDGSGGEHDPRRSSK